MKNITLQGILLGIGVLSASTFVAAPASAQSYTRRTVIERRTIVRHPGGVYRPRPTRVRSIRGIVTRNLSGNDFNLRLNNGRVVRVLVTTGEPRRISKGDLVEAYGRYDGSLFRANRAVILRNR